MLSRINEFWKFGMDDVLYRLKCSKERVLPHSEMIGVFLIIFISLLSLSAKDALAASFSQDSSTLQEGTISVYTNHSEYFVGDKITIYFIGTGLSKLSSSNSLEIYLKEDSSFFLKYLGNVEREILFMPQRSGTYEFSLTDIVSGSKKIISTQRITVSERTMRECASSFVEKQIFIDIEKYYSSGGYPSRLDIQYFDYISRETSRYVYEKDISAKVSFIFQKEGEYSFLADGRFLECYSVESAGSLTSLQNYVLSWTDLLEQNKILNGSSDSSVSEDFALMQNISMKFKDLNISRFEKKVMFDQTHEYTLELGDVDSDSSVRFEGLGQTDSVSDVRFITREILRDSIVQKNLRRSFMEGSINASNIFQDEILSDGVLADSVLGDNPEDQDTMLGNEQGYLSATREENVQGVVFEIGSLPAEIISDSVLYDSLSTDIVYVNNISIRNAVVRLSKSGPVTSIVRCDDFLVQDNSCNSWVVTKIPFTDMGEYVEFSVDHFSAYAGIIIITKADLLDENRSLMRNIFDEVREKDNVWVNITDGQYVRVVFEKNLSNVNDITIYVRSLYEGAIARVFEQNGSVVLAQFDNLSEEKYRTIWLTELNGSKDTFDIQVTGGTVEFDHIIDPGPINILNMTLLNNYTDNAPANSIEGARGMQFDYSRNLVIISSTTDDSFTILNYSNSSSISVFGSINDGAPPGSVDNIWFGTLDSSTNLFYAPGRNDDAFSIYNVTSSTPVHVVSATAATANPGSLDGVYDIAYVDIGTDRYAIASSAVSDTLSVYNVTNLSATPTVLFNRTTAANPCTTDDLRKLYNIPGTTLIVAASTTDDAISVFNISDGGIVSCVTNYSDSSPPNSIDGVQNFLYEESTKLLYVPGSVDHTLTILNFTTPWSYTEVGSINDTTNLNAVVSVAVGTVGNDKFAFLGSTATGRGIRLVNVTNPASPRYYTIFNQTSGTCIYNAVYSLQVIGNMLYATSGTDSCFYSIRLYETKGIPVMVSARIDPSAPNITNTLLGYCNATDDDNMTYAYVWYLNGAVNITGTTSQNFSSGQETNVANISSSQLATGQNWTFSCQANDTVSVSSWINSTQVTVTDTANPIVNLSYPSDMQQSGVGIFQFNYTPEDYSLRNCTLYIDVGGTWGPYTTNTTPINNQTNSFGNISLGVGVYSWNVLCFDNSNNSAFAQYNRTLNITASDINISSASIFFSAEPRIEGNNITIFVNITNTGLSPANSTFIVQFFKNDPDIDGVQIGVNKSLNNILPNSSEIVNTSYTLESGDNIIFVIVDVSGAVNETYENNNKANNTVKVEIYQYYYGNVTTNILLAAANNATIKAFENATTTEGVVLISDYDSIFSFTELQSLGRNVSGDVMINDFQELDTMINTSGLIDSIDVIWTNSTGTPLYTDTLIISGSVINFVPMINSTANYDFFTGILWDFGDDTSANGQYDSVDKEDVVFATPISGFRQGSYGVYNYEIRVPANIKNYKGLSGSVVFYYEMP